jgi:hypothetical protein
MRHPGGLAARTLACLFLFGCATVGPYSRPQAGTPLTEREKIYLEHRVSFEPISGVFKGTKMPTGYWGRRSFEDYYADSGDTEAAAILRGGTPSGVGAGLLYVGGLTCLIGLLLSPGGSVAIPLLLAGFGGGVTGSMVLTSQSKGDYILPAADHFDAYLRNDLGLAGDPSVPGPSAEGAPLFAEPSPKAVTEWYGSLGAGMTGISTYDLANYFLSPGDSSWSRSTDAEPQIDVGAGFVRPGGATLELRFDYLDRGQHGLFYAAHGSCGCETPAQVLQMNSLDLALVPGYTFTLARYPHGERVEGFAGFMAGPALLLAEGTQETSGGSTIGTYDLQSSALVWGPILRVQAASSRHGTVGVEFGYRVEKFSGMVVQDAWGSYAGRPSPDQTLNSAPAYLDFSGPFVNLNIQFGRFQWSR